MIVHFTIIVHWPCSKWKYAPRRLATLHILGLFSYNIILFSILLRSLSNLLEYNIKILLISSCLVFVGGVDEVNCNNYLHSFCTLTVTSIIRISVGTSLCLHHVPLLLPVVVYVNINKNRKVQQNNAKLDIDLNKTTLKKW